MKNSVVLSILFLLIACSSPVTRNDASIRFGGQEHDFGPLSYKKAMEHGFEFSNPGKTPLVISDVKTSCGCTAASWTKEPVKPGKSGTINIRHDAAFPGVFQKEITVHYNGPGSPVILKIRGSVDFPDDPKAENR